jgi:hypothetical protein
MSLSSVFRFKASKFIMTNYKRSSKLGNIRFNNYLFKGMLSKRILRKNKMFYRRQIFLRPSWFSAINKKYHKRMYTDEDKSLHLLFYHFK